MGYSAATTASRERQNCASHANRVDAKMAKEAAVLICDDGPHQILWAMDHHLGMCSLGEGNELSPSVGKVREEDARDEAERKEGEGESEKNESGERRMGFARNGVVVGGAVGEVKLKMWSFGREMSR